MNTATLTSPLLGHGATEQYFLDAWERGTMPHSILFTGAQGVGKAGFAQRLAAFVLAGGGGSALFGPQDLSIPEDSPLLRRMKAGSHGDFMLITPDTSTATAAIKVETIRKIGTFLSKTPSESAWRVIIIDSADDMNNNAANALLKLLEEPPSYSMIILISHLPGKLLPTIRSRCRIIPFKPISFKDFQTILGHHGYDDEEALLALHTLSHGSPGLALHLDAYRAFDIYGTLLDCLQKFPAIDEPSLASLVKQVAATKDNEKWGVWRMVWECWLYRLVQWQQGIVLPSIHESESAVLTRLGTAQGPEHWFRLQETAARWFHDTEVLHLDRKQVIHSLISEAVK